MSPGRKPKKVRIDTRFSARSETWMYDVVNCRTGEILHTGRKFKTAGAAGAAGVKWVQKNLSSSEIAAYDTYGDAAGAVPVESVHEDGSVDQETLEEALTELNVNIEKALDRSPLDEIIVDAYLIAVFEGNVVGVREDLKNFLQFYHHITRSIGEPFALGA